MVDEIKDVFMEEASHWVCEGYCLDVRFYSIKEDGEYVIQACLIGLNPLPLPVDNSFFIETESFAIGQLQKNDMHKEELESFIVSCVDGMLPVYDKNMSFVPDSSFRYYSEMTHNDRWFHNLHLKVYGQNVAVPKQHQLRNIENQLRSSCPAFDGLHDALNWLGIGDRNFLGSRSSELNIWINPPVDIFLEECSLIDDELTVVLKAHPSFDIKAIQLSICPAPRKYINSSRQIAREFQWSLSDENLKRGVAKISLKGSDSVLLMLLINGGTVRRQWLLDEGKARNNRQIPVQYFDKDLKMVKRAVFNETDSSKFEEGIALLLFMLGFIPAVQLETDSPDLIVYTPGGKLVLVECTMRIADFSNKVGKLVDRRGGLEKALSEQSHHSLVYGALVCRLPKDQIATLGIDLRENKIILVTKEDLEQAFLLLRNGVDPDKLIDDAIGGMEDVKTIPIDFDK